MDVSKVDKNFKTETSLPEKDIVFYDAKQPPFEIYGLYRPALPGSFRRMPEEAAKKVNQGVAQLYAKTSGGRVRFRTNSKYVAIKAALSGIVALPHMTLVGSAGFDMYIDGKSKSTYYKSFVPPAGMKDGYESIIYFEDGEYRDITINFPLYSGVDALYIGLQEGAEVLSGRQYAHKKPIVFYGSSITQGGCASRPGNSYPAIISRKLDSDFVNLGFSGSARGEDAMAEYIAGLDMSALVCDYDHNAPSISHLKATHITFYKRIREANENLPIVFVSKPDFENGRHSNILRRDVIYDTYILAYKAGDRNVYFIDGQSLFGGEDRDCCTVDSCHPNDLGFYRMAKVVGGVLKDILNR